MVMKFRAHDTFFIRKGWLSKGMRYVTQKPDVFIDKNENPMDVLGIGANMVKESFGEEETLNDDFSAKAMLPLALATSIDAFAVGVSFAAMQVQILPAAALIGTVTCLLSAAGVKAGAVFGCRYRAPAERVGGIVLILIGLKTLLSGLGIF